MRSSRKVRLISVMVSPRPRRAWISACRARVRAATRVAAPGCYATASILALAPLVGGPGVMVIRADGGADVAITDIRVPRATVGGDTLDIDVALTATAQGGPPSRLTLTMGDRIVATVSVDSVGPHGERVVRARVPVPNVNGSIVIGAAISATGDRTPANDSLANVVLSPSAVPRLRRVLAQERFDLVLPGKHLGSREVQGLLKVLRSPWLLAQLAALPGYDSSACGELLG